MEMKKDNQKYVDVMVISDIVTYTRLYSIPTS